MPRERRPVRLELWLDDRYLHVLLDDPTLVQAMQRVPYLVDPTASSAVSPGIREEVVRIAM